MSLGDRPFCAAHPGAYAEGTCPRCGNFTCGSCLDSAPGAVCKACHGRSPTGKVAQLPVLGVLMMVQGALVVMLGAIWLLGGGFAGLGIFLDPQAEADAAAGVAVLGVFGCFAMCMVGAGVIGIIAGWKARQGRARTLVWVGLFTAAFGGINMLCWMTGIGLLVFGIIVLIDPDVQRHFNDLAARG